MVHKQVPGLLPAHALTTIHFIVGRHQNMRVAERAIDWLLQHFEIATVGRAELLRARALGWKDFEDGVVAVAAESSGCKTIVTRNIRDFEDSPVSAMTPEEYLLG